MTFLEPWPRVSGVGLLELEDPGPARRLIAQAGLRQVVFEGTATSIFAKNSIIAKARER